MFPRCLHMGPETGPCVSEEEGEKYEFALDPETDQELIDALEAADEKGRLIASVFAEEKKE